MPIMQSVKAEETKPSISLHDASTSVDEDPLVGLDSPQAEPSSGAHRTQTTIHREADTILKQRPTEKRKRSRVTPEQLIELEREFAVNRTPTGAQRKAISERLGMQERQTQIWFQNRRAKAKHQDQRPSSPDRNRSAGQHLESYIAQLIREKEPVTLIPCSDLKIGHWTRINPSTLHHEVLAYTSQSRQCISWFIRSSGLSFKIEVPFSIIKNAQLMDVKAPQLITLVLELHSMPLFFVQQPDVRLRPGETINDVRKRIGIAPHLPLPDIGANPGEWVASNDWTQNQQASRVLRHELTGPRTSIIPGVQTFPQEFGLLQDDSSPPSGTDPTGENMPLFDSGSWWDNLHTLDVAHTPNSSVSGYESSVSWSTGSSVSLSSYAGSVHTPASSTRATPAPAFEFGEMNLSQDVPSIAQPVPLRASPLPPQFNPDAQGGHSHHNSLNLGMQPGLNELGFNPLALNDSSNQGLLSQQSTAPTHNFNLAQNFTFPPSQQQGQVADQALYAAAGSMPTNNSELLSTANITLSHYAKQRQHERKLSEALMAQQGTSQSSVQAPMFDFGLGQGLDLYTNQDFAQSTNGNGTVNLGFEVDATLGTSMGSHINTYPQLSQSFDDPNLYLQQSGAGQAFTGLSGFPSDGMSSGTTFDMNQFVSNPQAQAQLHPQTQGQGSSLAPGSDSDSRRNSSYGFQ